MGLAGSTLGQRIIEAARLALLLHLAQDGFEQQDGQQEPAGGAVAAPSRDGALPAAAEGGAA